MTHKYVLSMHKQTESVVTLDDVESFEMAP